MRLKRFEVEGFKNLTSKVVLDDLGSINVIHGENNVGKSNILQAMALFFRCLDPYPDQGLPIATARALLPGDLQGLDLDPADIFNFSSPAEVKMNAVLLTQEEELQAAGIQELWPANEVSISLALTWDGAKALVQIRSFVFEDGTDAVRLQRSQEEKTRVLRFAVFLARNILIRSQKTHQFAIVGMRRDADADLALEMFDARESTDLPRTRRWRAFVAEMKTFGDVTGPGEFVVSYDRTAGKARLLFETLAFRVPLRLLGTGVQQLAALLGHLFMTNASIVAIEEPELNLRYTLQVRLRDLLGRIVGTQAGPSQVFLTSHSPAFEVGDTFYAMHSTPQGPLIEKKHVQEAHSFTAHAVDVPSGNAPISYVTSEGLVRLPDRIRQVLRVDRGGGVIFWEKPESPYVQLLTNDQFLAELQGEEANGEPVQG